MMRDHFQTAWTHLRRSPYQALAAVGVMTLTFFIASVFVMLAAGSGAILRYFETRPQVTAFLKDDATQEEIDQVKSELDSTGKVTQIRYVSKEEALKIYQELLADDPLLLEMVTANILPASLEISTKEIVYLSEVADLLRNEPAVEEVSFQEEVVESLKSWTNSLRKIGLVVIAFLLTVSFLMILVIIGMKVAIRRSEIEILQLLGASSWYIRMPFIIEGIFYGVVGSFLAWGGAYLLLMYTTPFLISFLAGLPLLPVSVLFMLALLGGGLLLGALIGALGSLVAVRHYLR